MHHCCKKSSAKPTRAIASAGSWELFCETVWHRMLPVPPTTGGTVSLLLLPYRETREGSAAIKADTCTGVHLC
jgi:hypothetical protein